MSKASQALETLGKQMTAQEVNHKEQLKMLEDKMNEVDLPPRFDLANVPSRKLIRSPDISRQPIASPKFGQRINFFQADTTLSTISDLANNNKDILGDRDRAVLEVLEEGEETPDVDRQCEQHTKKIQELELSLASTETCLCQVKCIDNSTI